MDTMKKRMTELQHVLKLKGKIIPGWMDGSNSLCY